MLLENGAMIKQDVINYLFEKAVVAEENVAKGVSTEFWNFVESRHVHGFECFLCRHLHQECFEKLADEFELDQAVMRLEVLKTDLVWRQSK